MRIFKYFFILFFFFTQIAEANSGKILKCGWYSWEPYQYIDNKSENKKLLGLDVHILSAIAESIEYQVIFEKISWQQHQESLQSGLYDIAMGTTKLKEREKDYYFTKSYREGIDALFILKDSSEKLDFRNISELITLLKEKKFKLGITKGYLYSASELNAFVTDARYQDLIVLSDNTIENMTLLENKKIDGFLADHVNGTTIAWHRRMHDKIKTYEIGHNPIYFMLSKKSCSFDDLHQINQAIETYKKSDDYKLALKTYLITPLLLQVIDKQWFYILDIVGTIAFALSGIIIGYRVRATLFTTMTLALLPAIGGGMMRDIIVDRRPLGVLQTPDYLFAVFTTVMICYITFQCLAFLMSKNYITVKASFNKKFLERALDVFDALGLAAFTVIGTKVAVVSKCEPLWLWGPLLSAITGVGGGVIRDVIRPDRHVFMFISEFYAEVAIIWSLFLSLFLHFHRTHLSADEVLWSVIITLIGVFLTRMMASLYFVKGPQFLANLQD